MKTLKRVMVGGFFVALALWWAAAQVQAWLHQVLPHGPPGVVKPLTLSVLAELPFAYVGLRVWATRRLLARRIRYAALPTESFDPSADNVAAFARALLAIRKLVLGWLDWNASAFRILYVQAGAGMMCVVWEVPRRSVSAMLAAANALGPEVEITPAEGVDVLLPTLKALREPCPEGIHESRAELRLARPGCYPLRHVSLNPHPTQLFAAAFSMLQEEWDEDLIVDWSFLPVPGWRTQRVRKRLLRQAEKDETHGFLRLLRRLAKKEDAPQGRGTPAVGVERSAELKGLQEKVGLGEPQFHFQLLVSARSRNPNRTRAIINAVLAALEQWGEQNRLRVVGTSLLGSIFLGSDMPWRRWYFDLRLQTGLFRLFRPARRRYRNLVGAKEMAAPFTPPSKHAEAA